jgi:uncharacterized phage protein (TIGR01671 family)
MREIKFRAWNTEKHYMVDWDVVKTWHFYIVELPQWVFMQYTGLLDKTGKEIWEGDVVSICGHKSPDMCGVIKWGYCGFEIVWSKNNIRRKQLELDREPIFHNCNISLEVIGNIYENPELLANTQASL